MFSISRILLLFLTIALALAPERIRAQGDVSKEYQIKAAFLFHFAQFVEWPDSCFTNADAPIRIGVLGKNPFGGALEEIVKGETIGGRKIAVQYSRRVEDLNNCQIVFVCKTEASRLPQIFKELDGANSLTVGECDGFAARGGVINFVLEDGKVHFEINPDAAAREKLTISSQLYRLGKIIKTAPAN